MRGAKYLVGVLGALLFAAIVWGPLRAKAQKVGASNAPTQFQVDATWPKPLPNDPVSGKPWVTGEVGGTCVDSKDHIFTVNRASQNNLANGEDVIATAAPPFTEFDTAGNIVNAFGDANVVPNGLHGCFIDSQDNFWTAGNGDGIVQKYTHDGQFILQIGIRGRCDTEDRRCTGTPAPVEGNSSQRLLFLPANMAVDPDNGDVYIADGYGNHRIVVFDSKGTYLRQWGNAGLGAGQFQPNDGGHPHCVRIGKADGLVYTCDRGSDRIQVFEKNPTSCTGVPPNRVCQPVRIIPVIPGTGDINIGSAWDLDFSRDSGQSVMYEVDGGNEILHIFDRMAASIIGGFGQPGHQAGQFTFLHSVVIDSQGNLFTGETIGGRRVQKFVPARGANAKNL